MDPLTHWLHYGDKHLLLWCSFHVEQGLGGVENIFKYVNEEPFKSRVFFIISLYIFKNKSVVDLYCI